LKDLYLSPSQKKEEAEEDEVNEEDVPGEKGLLFEDQPSDGNYQPQAQR
jgi:hypothetical protein